MVSPCMGYGEETMEVLQRRSGYYKEDSQTLEVVKPEVASVPGSLMPPFLKRDLGRRLNPEGGAQQGLGGGTTEPNSVFLITNYCGL